MAAVRSTVRASLALLAALLAAACGAPPERTEDARSTIEFRLVAGADDAAVARLPRRDGGEPVPVEEPRRFEVAFARPDRDELGYPAVFFELTAADAERFRAFTAEHVGRELALVVDGRVIVAPRVHGPLPGAGVISAGAEGFDEAEAAALAATLNGER